MLDGDRVVCDGPRVIPRLAIDTCSVVVCHSFLFGIIKSIDGVGVVFDGLGIMFEVIITVGSVEIGECLIVFDGV